MFENGLIDGVSDGQIVWYLTASALVLFMTPGVAFLYGGLVNAKSAISMMMMSFGVMGLVTVLWILYGYNEGTMTTDGSGWINGVLGNPFSDFASITAGSPGDDGLTQPTGFPLIVSFFGCTFAIITVALISGAIADRAKFGAWMLFAGLWATLVYFPVQGWVWGYAVTSTNPDGTPATTENTGWIINLPHLLGFTTATQTLDWAGGTVVHINAGAAALALALVLGKRIGFPASASKPHNVPFVILGASILWFGWFGFNAGAAANFPNLGGIGILAFNTFGATAAAMLGWLITEKLKDGKATAVGAASGAVAGLVAITPACYWLTPGWALVLGLIVGAICALAVNLKYKLGFDDSLDVVGIHMVGGFVGCWFLGFFANKTGLIYSGNAEQLITQIISSVVVALYSFIIALILGLIIEKTMGFRIKGRDELAGVDVAVHGEEAYVLD